MQTCPAARKMILSCNVVQLISTFVLAFLVELFMPRLILWQTKMGIDTRWMSFAPCWSSTTRLSQFVNRHTSIREAVLTNFRGIFLFFNWQRWHFWKHSFRSWKIEIKNIERLGQNECLIYINPARKRYVALAVSLDRPNMGVTSLALILFALLALALLFLKLLSLGQR